MVSLCDMDLIASTTPQRERGGFPESYLAYYTRGRKAECHIQGIRGPGLPARCASCVPIGLVRSFGKAYVPSPMGD